MPSLSKPAHLISLVGLSSGTIQALLKHAQQFANDSAEGKTPTPLLQHRTVVNCFCENSTRTRVSFELAAKRLGATVVNLPVDQSSLKKGESLLDTAANLAAMKTDVLVLRHQEETVHQQLVEASFPGLSIVNAGSGRTEHPTQALLDLLTISQHKKNLAQLSVAILGDTSHSRVASSLITGLTTLGTQAIRLVGPANLLMAESDATGHVKRTTDLSQGLKDADVIVVLRLQKERMAQGDIPDTNTYFETYGLTEDRLKLAKPDALVMHPGPMNREVEIASSVADGPQSAILQQAANGVFVRMAVLAACV